MTTFLLSDKASNIADNYKPGHVPIQPLRVEVRTAVASLSNGLPAILMLANCQMVNQNF